MKSIITIVLCISTVSFASVAEVNASAQKSAAFSLVAVGGQDGGYCVLKSSGDRIDVVTTEGALSEKQLKQAVRYMSYREQWLNASFILLAPLPLGEFIAFTVGSVYPMIIHLKEQESPSATFLQVVAGGWLGPLIEFLQRRDRFSTITNEGINFTQTQEYSKWRLEESADFTTRIKERLFPLIGGNSTQGLGEIKGEKIIARLQIEPEFQGGCDHLLD